jgi:integrase
LDFALMPDVKHGRWRYRYDIRRPFTDFMRDTIGMPWVTPHVMRHSFASILKSAGVSNAKIAEWLGNSERVTERTYAHLKPDDRDVHALS